jgi:hypothetical protein
LTIHFSRGNWQALDGSEPKAVIRFDFYTYSFDLRSLKGSLAQRGKTLLEMGYSELARRALDDMALQQRESKALSELAKRFLVPVMSFGHGFLVIGLLFAIGPARVVSFSANAWIAVGMLFVHVLALAAVELMARKSVTAVLLVALAVLLEALAGWALLRRANQTLRGAPWLGVLWRGARIHLLRQSP